jgi:hypothetical protein
VRTVPGNIIAGHATAAALAGRLNRLRAAEAAQLYTLLPPPSWHMTLLDGVTGEGARA